MSDGWLQTPKAIGKKIGSAACAASLALSAALAVHGQTADQAWLRGRGAHTIEADVRVRVLGSDPLEQTAGNELERGASRLGLATAAERHGQEQIVIGTLDEVRKAFPSLHTPQHLDAHGFWLGSSIVQGKPLLVIAGSNPHGVLFGAFDLLRRANSGQDLTHLDVVDAPAMPIRWVDEWDNPDGSIERGYAGPSIFFQEGKVREDLSQVREYARLLASIGINGCNINNVNNAAVFLTPEMLKGVARIAETMRPYGVRVALSVDIASPQKLGGLKTYDPLDPQVIAWWKTKLDEVYKLIPDFAGVTVKADSEGQPGPASYGRTPADAANVLANALKPHGGVVLYRAFVYNHHLDWKDPKADRARAAYDIFHPLDGKFADNVIVQTKEGPIDFQAQEPVSPLLAGLEKTSQAMELQITQEYLGQQQHLVYIAPMWKWVLDFDLHAHDQHTAVKDLLGGKTFHRNLGGMVGVAGIGRDWLGSPLAMANLYAFGRLAWNPNLTPEQIAEEWTRQTLGNDPQVVKTVDAMLMQSWPAYVDYTGPLGMQTLTDITGSHYGPNIEASENNGWGQWHRADHEGVGMDRTVTTGTGYVGQYWPEVAKIYEDVKTTPDNLLTFFHHVPYTWKLQDGSTLIQYIYDSHYRGADEAARLGDEWATLQGKIDPKIYDEMRRRLEYQAGHAIVWRDAIVQYFWKLSGIEDAKGRAGNFPGRLEAGDAKLAGYTVIDVQPWEDASRGKGVSCSQQTCTAQWTYNGKPGTFDIAVQYFDLAAGTAHFQLLVNGRKAASWAADAKLPTPRPHGDNSTRYTAQGVALKPGDTLMVEGTPDAMDPASLDYIEVESQANQPR